MSDNRFIRVAITPPYFYPDEAAAIERLASEGDFDYIHIRKPGASEKEMQSLIESIDPALRTVLTLHDHFLIAAATGCGGLHLNSRNPVAPQGWQGRVSRSCHSLAGLSDASPGTSYLFLSPIFPSISKPGYRSDIMADPDLGSALGHCRVPVVALGGVTPDRIPLVKQFGFGGAAMLGAAWRRRPLDLSHFRLQLITHPYPGQDVVEGAVKALEGGCRWIQLRHKDANPDLLLAEAKAIAALRSRFGHFTFIIDDHVELVDEAGADGVHLGKNDMPPAKAREMLGPEKIVGSTANTLDDIREAARNGADYIGLGPFRFTLTKERLAPVLGTDGYRNIISAMNAEGIHLPVVAIGGITLDDVATLRSAGADGVAVSGAILREADPASAAASFIIKSSTDN